MQLRNGKLLCLKSLLINLIISKDYHNMLVLISSYSCGIWKAWL